METTNRMTVGIHRLDMLAQAIRKLNTKLTKRGLETVTYTVGDTYHLDETGGKYRHGESRHCYPVADVTINGIYPKLDGYTLVGMCDHREKIAFNLNEDDVPLHGYLSRCHCEHCNKDINRVRTFIVRNNKENRLVQVGASCLNEYVNADILKSTVGVCGWWNDIRDEYSCNPEREYADGSLPRFYMFEDIVPMTVSYIREYGFVSNTYSRDNGGMSTSDRVNNPFPYPVTHWYDRGECDKIIKWMKSYTTVESNGFLLNCQSMAKNGGCSPNTVGIMCAFVNMAIRHLDEEAIKEKTLSDIHNEHVGTVGDKLTDLSLTVTRLMVFDGYYGVTTIAICRDSDGHVFKLTKSGYTEWESGDTLTVKSAAIKSHDVYDGVNQTVIFKARGIARML